MQVSQNLQINYGQASTALLQQLVLIQYATANGTSLSQIPPLPALGADPSLSDFWINGLWFISLVLSLVTALMAALTKQWLYNYLCVPSGTPRDRARIRQFRHTGLAIWLVPAILDLLPVILHLALALFLAGLVIFLTPLNITISCIVGVLTAIAYSSYAISVVLPLIYPQCPYKSPLAIYLFSIANRFRFRIHSFAISCLQRFTSRHIDLPTTPASLLTVERDSVTGMANTLDRESIFWLYSASSNLTVRSIAIQALSGLPPGSAGSLPDDCHHHLWASITEICRPRTLNRPVPESYLERLLRASLHDDLHMNFNWPKFLLDNIPLSGSHLRSLLDIAPWLQNHPSVYPGMLESYLHGSENHVAFHPIVWEHILGRNVWFCKPNDRDNGFVGHMQPLADLVELLDAHSWWFGTSTVRFDACLDESSASTLTEVIMRDPHIRLATTKYLFWSFNVPFNEDFKEQGVHMFLIAVTTWLMSQGEILPRNKESFRHLLGTVISCLVPISNAQSSSQVLSDLKAHYEHLAGTIHSVIVSDKFFDDHLCALEARVVALEVFVCAITYDCDQYILQKHWYTEPFVKNIMRMLQACHSQLSSPSYNTRSHPISALGQGYFIMGLLFQNAPPDICDVFWGEETSSVLHQLPFPSRMSDYQYSHLTSRMRYFYTQYVNTLPLASLSFVENAHRPDVLFALCRTLILFRDEALLGKLVCIRPSHKSWSSCVQKLASLVHDESFIESHAKLHAPLGTKIQHPGEHIPETSFDPKKEIYTSILRLITALDYSLNLNDLHTELGSLTSQFVPLRRIQSNADKEKWVSFKP